MTQPHEVTVAQAEVERFLRLQEDLGTALALAAFLAARVPDAKPKGDFALNDLCDLAFDSGHNALRDAVLRGPAS